MKKLLLLLVGAVVAFAAHAQIYLLGAEVAGDWTSPLQSEKWTPSEPIQVNLTDGYYKFSAKGNVGFKMSTAKGTNSSDWDTFNNNAFAVNAKDGNSYIATWKKDRSSWIQAAETCKENSSAPYDCDNIRMYYRVKLENGKYIIEAAKNTNDFPEETTHTVYFYHHTNQNYAENVNAYIWFNDNIKISAWPGEQMTRVSGKFAKTADGNTYPLWAYTFKSTWTPQFVIMSNSGNKLTANDSPYVEKGFYTDGDQYATENVDIVGDIVEENSYTIYFYNSGSDNIKNVVAYVWNGSDENAKWPGEAMTLLTDKVVKTKTGQTYPVWAYTIKSTWKPSMVIISDGNKKFTNGDALFVDGGFYTNGSSSGVTNDVTLAAKEIEINDLYLTGKFNEWDTDDASYKFTSVDGIHYSLILPETINLVDDKVELKITGGNWGLRELTGKFSGFGIPFTVGQESYNISVPVKIEKGTKFILTYDVASNTGKLTIGEYQGGEIVTTPTRLYFHVKYDIDRHGYGDPWVYLYTKGASDNISYNEDNTHRKLKKVDPVNNEYSLWMIELSENDLKKFNACAFYFKDGKDHSKNKIFRSASYSNNPNDNVYGYEYDNNAWAKYIYATCTNNERDFAVQTYLTPELFETLVATDEAKGGHDKIYLTGGIYYAQTTRADNQEEGDWEKIGTTNNGGKQLSWLPTESLELIHDNGCFYLPIRNDGDRGFKISWINTAEHANKIDTYKRHNDRDWATFDLGLIGVDRDTPWVKQSQSDLIEGVEEDPIFPTYAGLIKPNGKLFFVQNKSVPYMNYNQADWLLPNDSKWYCLIVDTHPECHTATITTFNPHPTVDVTVSGALPLDPISASEAENIHGGSDCLYAANSYNGHVHMTKLNTASGTASITATSLSAVSNANFARTYYFYSNNVLAKTVNENEEGVDLRSINLDYLPLTNDTKNVAVRAMYKDNATKLTFHSRTGEATLKINVTLVAPKSPELKGRFIWEGTTGTSDIWGVYITGLDVQFENTPGHSLHDYSDFIFDQGGEVEMLYRGTGFTTGMERGKYPEDASKIFKLASEYIMPEVLNSQWKPGEDWSTYLRYAETSNPAPIFIHDVLTTPVGGKPTQDLEITGQIYIVHPFIYLPEGEFSVTSAPRRVAQAPASLNGFKVSHARIPATAGLRLIVSADDVVSAVEMIGADATNADAEVEYYTISGIRVMGDPAPGIYVRKQGTQVTKVVIR